MRLKVVLICTLLAILSTICHGMPLDEDNLANIAKEGDDPTTDKRNKVPAVTKTVPSGKPTPSGKPAPSAKPAAPDKSIDVQKKPDAPGQKGQTKVVIAKEAKDVKEVKSKITTAKPPLVTTNSPPTEAPPVVTGKSAATTAASPSGKPTSAPPTPTDGTKPTTQTGAPSSSAAPPATTPQPTSRSTVAPPVVKQDIKKTAKPKAKPKVPESVLPKIVEKEKEKEKETGEVIVPEPTVSPKEGESDVENSANNTKAMNGTTFHIAIRLLAEKYTDDLEYPINPVAQSLKKMVQTACEKVYSEDPTFKQFFLIKFTDSEKQENVADQREKVAKPPPAGVVVDFYLRFHTFGMHLTKLSADINDGKFDTHPVSPKFVRAYGAEPKGRVCTPDCRVQCYSYCDKGCCTVHMLTRLDMNQPALAQAQAPGVPAPPPAVPYLPPPPQPAPFPNYAPMPAPVNAPIQCPNICNTYCAPQCPNECCSPSYQPSFQAPYPPPNAFPAPLIPAAPAPAPAPYPAFQNPCSARGCGK